MNDSETSTTVPLLLEPDVINQLKAKLDWQPIIWRLSVLSVGVIIAVITVALLVIQRNQYPIRQKSPILLTLSVVGNFACIILGFLCVIYFKFFVEIQDVCIKNEDLAPPKDCIYSLIKEYETFRCITDAAGTLFSLFAQYYAAIPYLLRALRIKIMFEAREEYWFRDNMPRERILYWSDWRLSLYATLIMLCFSLPCAIYEYIEDTDLPNYNVLSRMTDDESGLLNEEDRLSKSLAIQTMTYIIMGMITCFAYYFAINWHINNTYYTRYNMKVELLLVIFFWFACSTTGQAFWMWNLLIVKDPDASGQPDTRFWSLSELVKMDFAVVFIRSFVLLAVTAWLNLYKSFTMDQSEMRM